MMTKEGWLASDDIDKAWYMDFEGDKNPLELGDKIRLIGFEENRSGYYRRYLGKTFKAVEGTYHKHYQKRYLDFNFMDIETGAAVYPGHSWYGVQFELVNEKETT